MSKIYQMSPHLADLIAAGEVVERPASVVKELTENSIDAGARSVTIEIKSGGMREIRVTDDGCGIAADDVETAFLRHATSKLRDERGLEAIGTLGFRGEALAAIASVSRIELLTRERGSTQGTRLLLEAGRKTDKSPRGLPEGTTVYVRDLFFNTPARQKFMKNDRAEGSAVTAAVIRLALSHPEISIRYIREGKEEYHTPGDGRLQSAAYCTLGREFARSLLEAANEVDGITVNGLVSTPAACRGNRAWQFFFVNGRAIKSRVLQAAVEQAYKNSLFTGRFPVCLLDIRMGLGSVDVNVHPTKMEVRFSDERRVFDAVYWAVRGALEREGGPKELTLSKSTLEATRSAAVYPESVPVQGSGAQTGSSIPDRDPDPPRPDRSAVLHREGGPSSSLGRDASRTAPDRGAALRSGSITGSFGTRPGGGFLSSRAEAKARDGFFKSVTAQDYRARGAKSGESGAKSAASAPMSASEDEGRVFSSDWYGGREDGEPDVHTDANTGTAPLSSALPFTPDTGEQDSIELPVSSPMTAETTVEVPNASPELDFRYVGEALNTYLIVERGDSIFLIDKHAAHERILFDRLKSQRYEPEPQLLLTPLVCRLDGDSAELLAENRELLERLGFEIDDFGGDSVALRQVPIDMDLSDPQALLEEIAGKLRLGGRRDIESMRDDLLHTVACKAAIKAGKRSEPEEVQGLIARVLSGEIRYCPHGRPVSMELTKSQLDRGFKRTG